MSKKQEIIDAAIREFGENSYDAASINRIIKASGTSKGTFYHYFSDKKDLYFSIIDEAVRIKQQYMARMMEQIQARTNFFEMMKAQTKAAAQFMKDKPDLYRFGTMYAKESGAIREEVAAKFVAPVGDIFQKIIEEGIAQGEFTDEFPPDFVAGVIRYLMMNYYDVLFDKEKPPAMEMIRERLDMLFDFIQRGLKP